MPKKKKKKTQATRPDWVGVLGNDSDERLVSEPEEASEVSDLRPVPEVREPTPREIPPIIVHRPAPVKRVIKKPPPRAA